MTVITDETTLVGTDPVQVDGAEPGAEYRGVP